MRSRLSRIGARRSKPKATAPGISQLDLWLQRFSHIAQFGLFALTLWAIYFTVIPLYQKALLDEQIARKEIELKRLQVAYEAAYTTIRHSAIRRFIFHAGADCSGLMEPLPTVGGKRKTDKEEAIPDGGLAIKPGECLRKELATPGVFADLTMADQVFFEQQLALATKDIEHEQDRALRQFHAAEQTAAARAPYSMPKTGFAAVVLDELLRGQPPEVVQQQLARHAVTEERQKASQQYMSALQARLMLLTKLRWPPPPAEGRVFAAGEKL